VVNGTSKFFAGMVWPPDVVAASRFIRRVKGLFPVPRECGFALMGVHAALRAALVRRIRAV